MSAAKKSSHAKPKAAVKHATHTAKQATHAVKHAAQSATHTTTKALEKAAQSAFSTLETTHKSAKSAVNVGADTLKEIFSNSAEEAQKAHAKAHAISREGTEAVSRTLDAATRTLNDLISLSRENVDVAVEVGNIVSDISRTTNAELVKYANGNFSDNLDLINEAFNCRNITDVLELNNKFVSTNLDNFFAQSSRLADIALQFANEAAEPVNDHILESAERLSKSLAA